MSIGFCTEYAQEKGNEYTERISMKINPRTLVTRDENVFMVFRYTMSAFLRLMLSEIRPVHSSYTASSNKRQHTAYQQFINRLLTDPRKPISRIPIPFQNGTTADLIRKLSPVTAYYNTIDASNNINQIYTKYKNYK